MQKPCSAGCGAVGEVNSPLDGQLLLGLPVVVTWTCPPCLEKENAAFVEQERKERRRQAPFDDPSDN